jgi:transcriptional regulator GlxA family with amidase domain
MTGAAETLRLPQGTISPEHRLWLAANRQNHFAVFPATAGASMTIHGSNVNATEISSARQGKTCRELVEQAENLARADINEPLHISSLCLALAVSERSLRKAFHEIHGLPPCRHLRMLRLRGARRALLSADCKLTTVTEIAMDFGFVELGRFAVEYRAVFGESPSQTLSCASQAGIFESGKGAAGHHNNPGICT